MPETMMIDLIDQTNGISPATVRHQMQRMLSCPLFRRSPRLSQFLQFTVEQTLKGDEDHLKEYWIGVAAFGRPDTFDPRLDAIVRVEARRLRSKVQEYYSTEGHGHELRIVYQPGSYAPLFIKPKRHGVMLAVADTDEADHWIQELDQLGYTVIGPVHSLDAACQLREHQTPDALLLDMNLIDSNSPEAALPSFGEATPVIALTSSLNEDTLGRLLQIGAAGYMMRPHRDGELRTVLELAWARRSGHEASCFL